MLALFMTALKTVPGNNEQSKQPVAPLPNPTLGGAQPIPH